MPSRLPFALAAFALAAAGATARADGVALGPAEFSPAEFVPGEVVTVTASLDPGTGSWEAAAMSSGFPETGESGPVVLSASVERRRGGPVLVIRFVPWKAGPGFLPELRIGGLDVPRVRFECGSALSGGDLGAPEPLPQLDYPGLYARLYIAAGALLVAAVAVAVAVAKAAPWVRSMSARRAFARVRREFDELLDRLGTRGGSAGEAAAWAALCSGARRFVGRRSGIDLDALTATEVAALPPESVPGGVRDAVAALLAAGDAVRFAGDEGARLSGGLESARSLADLIDGACRPGGRRQA